MEKSGDAVERTQRLSIAEAARALGVSERTVYRRLKSGQIQRSDVSDKDMTIGKAVMVDVIEREGNSSPNVGQMSDKRAETLYLELREDLRQKDVQIAGLLENERELTRTIRQMQEQLYELARLVLSQEPSAASRTQPASDNAAERVGGLARLFPNLSRRRAAKKTG